MPISRFLTLDVFAATHGGGNPLGVVVDAHDWSDAEMQAFASWTDLVETTFLTRADGADYRVRIFTPTHEIPYAGHPSVGSAYAAIHAGYATPRDGRLVQRCGAGDIPLRVVPGDGDPAGEISVRAPDATIVSTDAPDDLLALLRDVPLGAIAPACVEGGRRWWIAEVADEGALRRYAVDFERTRTVAKRTGTLGLCLFARANGRGRAAVATATGDARYDVVVRAFPAGVGIVEDPASGAANGLLAAYLAQVEPESPLAQGYVVSQGREMGRDARLVIRRDADGIWVGGRTHVIVDGRVDWGSR